MTDLTSRQILDAIRKGMEETARSFEKEAPAERKPAQEKPRRRRPAAVDAKGETAVRRKA